MKERPLCVLCLILIVMQVLMAAAGVRKMTPAASVFEKNHNANLSAEGQVCKKEQYTDYQILYLKDTSVLCQNQKISHLNIIVYDETFADISLGNKVFVYGVCMPFEEPGNPGNYNQKFYYEKQGITTAVWGSELVKISSEVWYVREGLSVFREKWHLMLCQTLGEKNGGMLSAMMLGERRELDQELKELYQVNGIGHLLAISGLHLSFVGLSLYQFLRKTGLTYKEAGFLGCLALLLYTIMSGLSVSAIRAFVMFVIRIGADMTGRVYDMLTSLAVAAAVIICWRPLYAFDAGFLLSFGAIIGILFLYPLIQKIIPFHMKYLSGFQAGLAIQIFLFPVTVYFFYEIPLYSVLINLIVIPLMSFLLGIGFIGSLGYLIHPQLGKISLKSSRWIFEVYDRLCQKTVTFPGARLVIGQIKVVADGGLLSHFIRVYLACGKKDTV